MGKGFNNYMTKKFFHPGSKENIKRVWIAQQKTTYEKQKQDDLLAQYQKEQEMYRNKALLGDEKAKMGLSFLYDAPPGFKKEEKEETETEVKFEWQRKYNAPREQYAKNDDTICDQPFGIEVRNVRCIKCRKWGHVNTDRICPLFGQDLTAEPPQPATSASSLLESMQADGFTLKKSLLGKMMDPKASNQKLLESEDEDDPEVQFLKSLTPKQKKKLLKKLNKLQDKRQDGKVSKNKKKKKKSKQKKKKHTSDSEDNEEDWGKKRRERETSDSDSSSDSEDASPRKHKSVMDAKARDSHRKDKSRKDSVRPKCHESKHREDYTHPRQSDKISAGSGEDRRQRSRERNLERSMKKSRRHESSDSDSSPSPVRNTNHRDRDGSRSYSINRGYAHQHPHSQRSSDRGKYQSQHRERSHDRDVNHRGHTSGSREDSHSHPKYRSRSDSKRHRQHHYARNERSRSPERK